MDEYALRSQHAPLAQRKRARTTAANAELLSLEQSNRSPAQKSFLAAPRSSVHCPDTDPLAIAFQSLFVSLGVMAIQFFRAHHSASFSGNRPGTPQGACQCLLIMHKEGGSQWPMFC